MSNTMNINSKRVLFALFESFNSDDSSDSSSTDSEESISDDEDFFLAYGNLSENKRRCIRNYFEKVVNKYTDDTFKMHFRISRTLFATLAKQYRDSDDYKKISDQYNVKSAEKSLAVFLWFAGHEACCYRDLADRFDLSLWTVHHIIYRVNMFISGLSNKIILWPDEVQQEATADHFLRKTKFPGVIGCIDTTCIKIDKPKTNPDDYIDQKGVTSIILQGICNENKKFIDINIGWPGSAHDSHILKNSAVYTKFKNIRNGYHLLGDSAYRCLKHLMVPYNDNSHLTTSQKQFNRTLNSCRVNIEHCHELLKQRFPQMYHCKLKCMKTLCHFVRACCVLHNLCDFNEDSELFDYIDKNPVNNEKHTNNTEDNGSPLRDKICQQMSL